jgi:hypothetical protein
MPEIFFSNKCQRKAVSYGTFDYGSFVTTAQNDKLVAKKVPMPKQKFFKFSVK